MRSIAPIALVCALAAAPTPAFALNVERDVVALHTVELPAVSTEGVDLTAVRAELVLAGIEIGEPVLRKTKTWCVPRGSRNKLKDAVELETHYYDVPYRVPGAVLVVRTGDGRVMHAERFDAVESSEPFGKDQCRYWIPASLDDDFRKQRAAHRAAIEAGARESFENRAAPRVDRALFVTVLEEKFPVYRFKDKKHDYADLDEAANLADHGYAALENGVAGLASTESPELERAIELWTAALEDADLGDKKARINRKVAARLHENIGAAHLALGDPAEAVRAFEASIRTLGRTTSRSNGTGSQDLLARAYDRKRRGRAQHADEAGVDIDRLLAEGDRHRGRIPLDSLPPTAYATVESEYGTFVAGAVVETFEAERAEHDAAVAAGEINPYENRVQHTALQGYMLFLMPFGERLEAFPAEVCELTHLNRLRLPNHGFDAVPEEIGEMAALEILDLSGNRLTTLPESIGRLANLEKLDLSDNRIETLPESLAGLTGLKVLKVAGNPLADGERERLARLLPGCKIKG